MVENLIFDLDQTLIDSSIAESYRRSGQWSQVYATIPSFRSYTGITDLLSYTREKDLKICIVTTSPSTYCKKVLEHWGIPYHHTICYHDVKKRKPDPEAFLKALELLKAKPEETLSFGDRVIDIQASKAAGVRSVACLWGSAEVAQLVRSQPTYIANTPLEALTILKSS